MSQELHTKQRHAAWLLAQGLTHIDVAARLEMRRETLSRWKRIPEFRKEYERVMAIMAEDMRRQLLSMGGLAIQSVNDALRIDPSAKTGMDVLKLFGIGHILRANTLPMSPSMPETLSDVTENPSQTL